MRIRSFGLAVLVLFTLIPFSAWAATLDQSQLASNFADPWVFVGDPHTNTIGQSFTAGLSGGLTQINVFSNGQIGGGSNSVFLEVLAGDGTGGPVLGSVTDTFGPGSTTLAFDLSSAGINVTAGLKYTFWMPNVPGGSGDLPTRGILYDDANPYAGGRSYQAAAVYGDQPNWDLAFQTYVGTAVATPEPASVTLIGVGLFGLSLLKLRKRTA